MGEYTYVTKKKCPICEQQTRIVRMRARLLNQETDEDFCVHFRGVDPYLYHIVTCEHCGFSEDENHFLQPMPVLMTRGIRDYIEKNTVPIFPFKEERTPEDAAKLYTASLTFATAGGETIAHHAGIYLHLAWMYRLEKMHDEEIQALGKAAELYDKSIMEERYPIGVMSDNMALYLTGAIYYRMDEIEKATQYLSRLMSDKKFRDEDPRLFVHVRKLWQTIREQKQA